MSCEYEIKATFLTVVDSLSFIETLFKLGRLHGVFLLEDHYFFHKFHDAYANDELLPPLPEELVRVRKATEYKGYGTTNLFTRSLKRSVEQLLGRDDRAANMTVPDELPWQSEFYFDLPDFFLSRLLNSGLVGQQRTRSFLTYKRKVSKCDERLNNIFVSNEEREVELFGADEMILILRRILSGTPTVSVKKLRISFEYEKLNCTIDFVDRLGFFFELEYLDNSSFNCKPSGREDGFSVNHHVAKEEPYSKLRGSLVGILETASINSVFLSHVGYSLMFLFGKRRNFFERFIVSSSNDN